MLFMIFGHYFWFYILKSMLIIILQTTQYCNEMHLCKWVSMRVESVLECVPCARVSNQIIVYTSPNYRNKINSATHSESWHGIRSGNMALSGVENGLRWVGDNLRENWRRFKQHAELMFSGPLKSRSEAEKCSYLLIWSSQKGRDIFNTWQNLTQDDKKRL